MKDIMGHTISKQIETAYINWGTQFTPSYVQHILGVKGDVNGLGTITSSNYLPKELFTKNYRYKNGDLYIISQHLTNYSETTDNVLVPCVYHLVQINAETELGYVIVETVRESSSYPYPENKLVSKILRESELLNSFGTQ